MYAVGKLAIDIEPQLQQAIADAEELPNAVTAWSLAHGKHGNYNTEEELAVDTLEEMKLLRLDHNFEEASPSRVLAEYDRAIQKGDTTVMRWVESHHGNGWTGAQNSDTKEATAAQQLRRRIKATRQARVPEEFQRLRTTIANANKVMERMKDVYRAVP